jgi:hypothetical protein
VSFDRYRFGLVAKRVIVWRFCSLTLFGYGGMGGRRFCAGLAAWGLKEACTISSLDWTDAAGFGGIGLI